MSQKASASAFSSTILRRSVCALVGAPARFSMFGNNLVLNRVNRIRIYFGQYFRYQPGNYPVGIGFPVLIEVK
jgi:hypothetical protein